MNHAPKCGRNADQHTATRTTPPPTIRRKGSAMKSRDAVGRTVAGIVQKVISDDGMKVASVNAIVFDDGTALIPRVHEARDPGHPGAYYVDFEKVRVKQEQKTK